MQFHSIDLFFSIPFSQMKELFLSSSKKKLSEKEKEKEKTPSPKNQHKPMSEVSVSVQPDNRVSSLTNCHFGSIHLRFRCHFRLSTSQRVAVCQRRKQVRCQNETCRKRVPKCRTYRATAAVMYHHHHHSSRRNRKPVGSSLSNGFRATRTNHPMRSRNHRRWCVDRTQP